MAECNESTKRKISRIIVHGNNLSKSSSLFQKLKIPHEENVYQTENYEFFESSDLNNRYPLFQPNSKMAKLIEESEQGIEVSAILLLITHSAAFSEGMYSLILKLQSHKFYGFHEKNQKNWWNHVIVVLTFGKDEEKHEEKMKSTMKSNKGFKEFIRKVEERCIYTSNSTSSEEFIQELQKNIKLLKGNLIIEQSHPIW